VMRARPVPGDRLDRAGVELGQSRVVDHQHPASPHDERLGLGPERLGVGLEAVEQPSERIVGRGRVCSRSSLVGHFGARAILIAVRATGRVATKIISGSAINLLGDGISWNGGLAVTA